MAIPKLPVLALVLFSFGAPLTGFAATEQTTGSEQAIRKNIAKVQAAFEHEIDVRGFQTSRPLSQFLKELGEQLPKGKRITFRIDPQAFGKEPAKILKMPVQFQPFPKRMRLSTALRLAIAKTLDRTVDYGISAGEVLITTPERAPIFTLTLDISHAISTTAALIRFRPAWLAPPGVIRPDMQGVVPNPRPPGVIGIGKRDPAWKAGALIDLIQSTVSPEDWAPRSRANIEIVNGNKLIVQASYQRQMEIADLVEALRRLNDVAVLMDATIHEVDRKFFERHIRPVIAPREGETFLAAIPINMDLASLLEAQKVIVKGPDVKLLEDQEACFLSLHSSFRFLAQSSRRRTASTEPEQGRIAAKNVEFRTGVEGVSLHARVKVSPDRRAIRLNLRQTGAELLDLKTTEILNLVSGKKVTVESPNFRHTSSEAHVEIDDGQPLMMPLDYRSKEARAGDRVWILLAKPWIYIEEEQKLIRQGGPPVRPSPRKPDPKPPAPARSPQVEQLLHALVKDVLTNRDLHDTREFYGTPGRKEFTLEDGDVGWPDWFQPKVAGFRYLPRDRVKTNGWAKRMLGIRLDGFDLKKKAAASDLVGLSAPIQVVISNVGGSANGAVIGGCFVSYSVKQDGKRWVVEFHGAFDP
jgi:hypothetical protein